MEKTSEDRATPAFRIGELAAMTELTPDTLRYYERTGLLTSPRRSPGGFRLFGHEAVERVRFVKQAQALGLELDEIRQLFRAQGARGKAQCRRVQPMLQARLVELDARLQELRGLRRTLKRALNTCKRQLTSDPDGVCRVVEELERGTRPVPARRPKARAPRRTRSAS